MTTDEKIDEVLRVVRQESENNESRFARLEERDDALLKRIEEQGDYLLKEIRVLGERSEARDNELMGLFLEERKLNNARFTQLSTGMMDMRKEIGQIKVEMTQMDVGLNAKIDRVYDSLSQDIQAFSGDLRKVERRVTRLEKKNLS